MAEVKNVRADAPVLQSGFQKSRGKNFLRVMFAIAIATTNASYAMAQTPDSAKAAAGAEVYAEHCASCHGEKLRNTGQTFDIRKLAADERSRFDRAVLGGKGQMPPWAGVLDESEIDQLWHYVRANAEAP